MWTPGIEAVDAEHAEGEEGCGKRHASKAKYGYLVRAGGGDEGVEAEEGDDVPWPEPGGADGTVEEPDASEPAHEAG